MSRFMAHCGKKNTRAFEPYPGFAQPNNEECAAEALQSDFARVAGG
jgi:hypothetical protein